MPKLNGIPKSAKKPYWWPSVRSTPCPTTTRCAIRLAAYLFLSGKANQATFFMEEALVKNFEGHTLLLETFPALAENSSFMNLIDLYRNQ
jgi:hypothetical protein